jgi:transcriptional regulator with XRE-family HTH domain
MNNYTTGGPCPRKDPQGPLGTRLQSLRLEKKWTAAELAAKSGVSDTVIHHIERGRNEPSLFSAICLADALGVSLDYLATGRGTR